MRMRSLSTQPETVRSIISRAKGTQPIRREEAPPQVVVEKVVQVVVEPRVVQVLVMPESASLAPASFASAAVSSGRARRITDAYQATDEAPRKLLAIA